MCAEAWVSCLCQGRRAVKLLDTSVCLSCLHCYFCGARVKQRCPTAPQTVRSANMSNERPENPVSSAPTEGQKKKRGRPRKQPQEDTVEQPSETKPRGRPKGSKKKTTVTEETAEPSGEKRRRGRPRKWPQAVVKEGESQEGDPQGGGDSNLNSAPAAQGITAKRGSRPGKTAGFKRPQSTIPATAQ